MKVILAVILLGLVSSTLAFYNVKEVPKSIIDTSFLKNAKTVKKHTFAGLTNLMEQLRDVSQVQEFLRGLLQQLADIRVQKLAIIEQTRSDCAVEAAFREGEVQSGETGAANAQKQINECTSARERAVNIGELSANALAIYESALEDLNNKRDREAAEHESRVAKLNAARDVVAQLQALIDEFEAEANSPLDSNQFLQISNKLLKHSVSTGHSHLVLPVFTKLLQIHAKQSVNADDIAEIRRLLNVLDENAANTIQQLDDQEAQDQQDYENERDRLQGLIDRMNLQVAATQSAVAVADQCLAQEESVLALANDKVTRNGDLLTVAGQLCAASEEEWRLSENNRVTEVNIITSISNAINKIEGDYEAEKGPQVGDIIQVRLL